MYQLALTAAQILTMLIAPGLFIGWIKSWKALLQGRKGPGMLQPIKDAMKWMRKDAVISHDASWLTTASPYLVFGLALLAGLMLPIVTAAAPLAFAGDLILLVYVFAAMRFLTVLAALDAGANFGGMGASRELAISAVVEPAFLLSLLPVMIQAGSAGLQVIAQQDGTFGIARLLAAIAFLLALVAETGRVPVDNPDTHLELTMVHEGMVLEFSGRYLGLMNMAAWGKQWLLAVLGAYVMFPPFGLPLWIEIAVKTAVIGIILAVIETFNAKMRVYRIPRYAGISVFLSLIALLVQFPV
ncbi:respiratory chain complex I subunit 1 family protein [Ferviditalea candida]|uniref:NADH-quinone oxidoreductase subunit H n=1 Tax=Ferviditalea candida TaxID=3108399 RepID=A0ABU5ZKQ8_9BACL|nr:NADH-quinone oxidoreductase subunit H [Paenibacillaceae bacterium T2]